MSQMIYEDFLTETWAGSVNTIFFISYAVGQLINGYLGDRFRSDRMILIGVLSGGFCNLAMGLCPTYHLMPVIWAVNGYALSMLWPPMLRLFANQMRPDESAARSVHMASACSLGAVAASLLCSLLVAVLNWRYAFVISALCLLLPGIGWWLLGPRVIDYSTAAAGIKSRQKQSHSVSMFLSFTMLITLGIVFIQGMLRDGITSWVPTMITAQFHTPPSLSILMSTVLPIITLIGPYAAHWVYKHWHLTETSTSTIFFSAAVIALVVIRMATALPAAVSVSAFAVVTSSMEAVNVMFLSILPLRYAAEGKTSTMTGLFNFTTYMGSALSAYTAGLIVEHWGWNSAISTWLLLAALAIFLCILIRKRHMHK